MSTLNSKQHGTIKNLAWGLLSMPIAAYLLLVPAASRSALVSFDFERAVFLDPGRLVKDHSLIELDGTFHLYYIIDGERVFGYASSPDLVHWIVHGPVLRPGPGSWDGYNVWAPSVIRYPHAEQYMMFYTGVNSHIAQRTCQAMTTDPSAWHKTPLAVFTPFHGDTAWISWEEDCWSNYRDPGFLDDGGVLYLSHTVKTRDGLGAVALASSEDFFNWSDAGPLYIHNNWHAIESTFLLKRNQLYHLFFTEEAVGGISHMSSDSLASGWDIITRSIIDGGHAVELTGIDGSGRHIFSRHSLYMAQGGIEISTIRFDTLTWNGDIPEVIPGKPPGNGWTVLWGTAFDHQPVFGDNPLYRGDDSTVTGFEGNWWIGTYEQFDGPLRGVQPGSFQGDGARGAIRSETFTVTGRSMRLLVGGGDYPDSCYVALCDASNDDIIYRETGRDTDLVDERFWDLEPFSGHDVYITIVDDCTGPFGHINVDGISELARPTPQPGGGGDGIDPGKGKRFSLAEHARTAIPETPARNNTLANYPNPFNPVTEIRCTGVPGSVLDVVIYSVTGAEIRSYRLRTDAAGTASVQWDGRDRSGVLAASGVYIAALRDGVRLLAVCKLTLLR